jgi:L-alanine-DL-glutamate epimerase-like enolase superfamily enzyme
MTDEVPDFLKTWTAKHDADLTTIRESQLRMELRVGVIVQRLSAVDVALADIEATYSIVLLVAKDAWN